MSENNIYSFDKPIVIMFTDGDTLANGAANMLIKLLELKLIQVPQDEK